MNLPAEEYIELYIELAEYLMRRDCVTLEYQKPDEFGNVERTDESDDVFCEYSNEAGSLLTELGIYKEGSEEAFIQSVISESNENCDEVFRISRSDIDNISGGSES